MRPGEGMPSLGWGRGVRSAEVWSVCCGGRLILFGMSGDGVAVSK